MKITPRTGSIAGIREGAEYVYRLTLTQIRHSAKNYTLGVFWWFADPIINTVILFAVTVVILGNRTEDMAIFLLSGLVMFRFLQTAINGACTSLNQAIALSSRLYVPKYAFVVRDVMVELLKLLIGVVFLMVGMRFFDGSVFSAFETLIVIATGLTFSLAMASLVALATAFIPDVRVVVGYVFRALFFVSGLFFSIDRVPEEWRNAFLCNPFALLVHEFRLAMISPESIDPGWLGTLMLASTAVGIVGFYLLGRFDRVLPKYAL